MEILAATLAVLMAGASGAAAQTGDWRLLGQDGSVDVAVDVYSFSGPLERRAARSAMVPWEGDHSYSYVVVNFVIDCTARTFSGVSIGSYDARGGLLGQRDLPSDPAPVKESDGTAETANAACEGTEISGRGFESAPAFAAWATARRTL